MENIMLFSWKVWQNLSMTDESNIFSTKHIYSNHGMQWTLFKSFDFALHAAL